MKVFSVLISRVIIGISYAVITMTLLCIAYFTLLSDSSYHIVYAIFSCIGFVLAYFIYYIAMKFHDGV
ncbi:hypothetical protein AS657_02520 [Serratia marcescens]|nr:hypothetical protein AS657_02520 [Serratia marcescens]PIJ12329.1 hypothetical protein BVV00_01410 [Serratia sp. OMLW3]PIJ16548.1 hypothetical protein BVU99_10265 [Serratia sp. OLAL2]KFF80645.1 hypothetical protein IY40_02950 [Serratia marcescens]CAI2102273.1 Uncharacterised protein [Serratia marcescens]